jgi:hypothetical protein
MNDDYTFMKDRRRFMKNTGSLAALGSLPAYLTANPAELKSPLNELQQHQGIVLYREALTHSVAFADTLANAGLKAVALSDDLVRQWRGGLGEELSVAGKPVLGLTNWTDYFVISGLAAEQRKHVLLEMQHMEEQPGTANWSANLAAAFLHLPVNADQGSIQALMQDTLSGQTIKTGNKTLFSWLIA